MVTKENGTVAIKMNIYVLYCQVIKTEKVCNMLNRKEGIYAFIPRMETYLHTSDEVILKVMFPGYVFVKTTLLQEEFDALLMLSHDEKHGIIKELKKQDVAALTDDEIQLLSKLLNAQGILQMSTGYKENGKTIVTDGPLRFFQDAIIKTDKRDMIAILDVNFLNRNIKAGIVLKQNK